MIVKVSTITGKTENISADNVEELKESIFNIMGIPVEEQKLLANGKLLNNENFCDSVQLLINLEGGAKGKKKKAATKKTKKKHKHKKVPLRILNCYVLDGEKVTRKNKMCELCTPGTFLAEHDDRLYCGRCHSSYKKLVDNKEVKKKVQKKEPKKVVQEPVVEDKKGKKKGKK